MRLWLEIPEGVDLGVFEAKYDFLPHRNNSLDIASPNFQ